MKIINGADVKIRPINWLWFGRIPLGNITIIEGDPDTNKSTLLAKIAAHVTTGEDFPDSAGCEKGNVVWISAEDPVREVTAPRLMAAGADLAKIFFFSRDDDEEPFTIPQHTPLLEDAVKKTEAKLVVIDTFAAVLAKEVDDYRDHHVRRALVKLVHMADANNLAVIFVRHHNKRTGVKALYKGSGSIGIAGAARSVWQVTRDIADPNKRYMTCVKGNWSGVKTGIVFSIHGAELLLETGEVSSTSAIEWEGEAAIDANRLTAVAEDNTEAGAVSDATTFLLEELSKGPRPVADLYLAARRAGISVASLRRASEGMSTLTKYKEGFGSEGQWYWSLGDSNLEKIMSWVTPTDLES